MLKKGHRGPPPYEVGSSPLTWYVGGSGQGHVCKPYLAALLQASSLLHVGVGEIPHLAHARRYRAMLKLLDAKGHAPALARPASQIDCDVDMDGSLCVANVNVDVGTGSAEAAEGSDSDSDLGEAGSNRTTSNGETSEDSYHEASDLEAPPMAAPPASESFEELQVLPQSELPEPEVSKHAEPTRRSRHPGSGHWGVFLLTYVKPGLGKACGAWQATCPFHAKNDRTPCRKTANIKSPGDAAAMSHAQELVKLWATTAPNFKYQREHIAWNPRFEDLPDPDVLDISCITVSPAGPV